MAAGRPVGSVLGRSEIRRRLFDGEIFVPETWSTLQLRGAAYDLRVDDAYLVTPEGKRYWDRGPDSYKKRDRPVILLPGDVAFVSSFETLRMPEDLVGNIATQFRKALSGILVMGGLLVDPGYVGQLHFQLANIGTDPFVICPEETSVAALQFLPLIGRAELDRVDGPPSNGELLNEMFNLEMKDQPLGPLAFFTLKKQTEEIKEAVEEGSREVRFVKDSSNALILFGIVVILAAILATALGTLMGGSSESTTIVIPNRATKSAVVQSPQIQARPSAPER